MVELTTVLSASSGSGGRTGSPRIAGLAVLSTGSPFRKSQYPLTEEDTKPKMAANGQACTRHCSSLPSVCERVSE